MAAHLTDLFQVVLEASWQSSLVILLILLLRPLMGTSIPARWRYLLWALVLIRLLIPISVFPSNPVSMQNLAVVDRPLEQVQSVLPQARETEPYPGLVRQGPETSEPPSAPPIPSAKPFSIPWWLVASAVWLAGTLIALLTMAYAQVVLWRRLGRNRTPVDPALLALWNKCCLRLGLKSWPVLRMSPDVDSPALVGLIRPVLLIPEQDIAAFSPQDWENVFVHELAHYCRADHWMHALQWVALALHWFNPLVWLGFRQLRADRELATDEWALHHLEPERSTAYGNTLLKVLAQPSTRNLSVACVGILEDRVQLKQRMQRIVAFGPRTLIGSLLGLGIVVAVAVVVLGRPTEKADLTYYSDMQPDEIMVRAALLGDIPVMRKMLHDGVDVNVFCSSLKQSPLVAAVVAGQPEAMRFLISKGADVNRRVDKHPTAIEAALQNGRTDYLQYLLDHGATCDPVMLAAAKGDQKALGPVLAKDPADLDQLKILCRTAAANGQADLFRLLTQKIRTQQGQSDWYLDDGTVLIAIARGHRDVVQAALDESPFMQKLNKGGVMRLAGAAAQSPGMRDWLISKGFVVPEYTDGERLIDATERQDLPEMARLLKAGVDVNYRGESSWTPITKAAAWNRVHSVKFLLAHGADPNSVHLPGWDYTPICLTNKPEIADMLLAAGGNPNATLYKRGVHIMDYSVMFEATDMVKWYLAHGVDPTKAQADGDGRTFLFDASNPEIAELLIQHGVDVKAKAKDGSTALHWICMFGKKPAETARVLLKHGADPNARDNYGITPLMRAKDGATVDVLVEYGADVHAKTKDGESLLAAGGAYADPSWIAALIRHGATYDAKTDGPTKLMSAAWQNKVDIMAYLLKQGVDPNLKGTWNKAAHDYMTPLEAAVVDGQYDAAKLLVDNGAKIDEQVMRDAVFNRRTAIVKLFWDHGNRSISELTYAISQGRPAGEIQKLLDGGAPADPPADKSVRPLTLAAELGQMDVVKLLMQRGATVKGATSDTLAEAAEQGQDEIVAYLLQNGAKADYQSLWNAVWNSHPYEDQRSKDHFEKTVRLLLNAGAARNFSEHQSADMLCASIFTRYPAGNTAVVKMLLDAGMSMKARNSRGQSVIDLVHAACKENTCSTPTKEMMAFLDQEGKGTSTTK